MPSTHHNKVESHYPLANTPAPKGWAKVFVGDVCLGIHPGFASGQHNSTGEGVPHLRPMNISREGRLDFSDVRYVADKDGSRLKQGDVLFNNTNSNELIGKTCWIDTDRELAFSNHMTRLRLGGGMSPSFVAGQLHFLWMTGYLRYRCTSHVNQASISSKTLAQTIPLFVPPSHEQERIVAKLDALLSRVVAGEAAARRALERLKRYRAAVLHAAVTGELTRDWRKKQSTLNPQQETGAKLLQRLLQERRARWEAAELKRLHAAGKPPKDDKWKKRYPEPKLAKTTGFADVPRGWVWTSVDQLATGEPGAIQSGPFGSQLLHSEFVNKGILAIGIDNVLDGVFSMGREHRITAKKYERLKKFTARPLDVVITVMATVGRVCVLPENLETAIITKHCYRISPPAQFVDSRYLAFTLRADAATRQHIFGNVRGQTRAGINGGILKVAPVPLPPLDEQREIVREVERRLAAVDRLAATLQRQLDRARALRQSLLREAFAGNLVRQDPDDEPASALLARLRATREAKAKIKSSPVPRKSEPVH